MGTLTGKVAWITGAGSGIGQAGALALATAGAHVVLSGRRSEALAETEGLVRDAGGEGAVEPLDVADVQAVQALADRIDAAHGRLDILVNSAGVNIPGRHFGDLTPRSWDMVVDINLSGAAYCIMAAIPIMRRQKGGLVVNVASWAGRFDEYLSGPAYNASKHGLVSLNASLNIEECVYGIRACVICPGEVVTPLLTKRPKPPSNEDIARMMKPEDMGRTILFVAEMPPHVCVNEILITPTWNRIILGAEDLRREIPS